ncbi:uncharacterized protein LOC121242329 [Juglans microcarpa x Juglans regia]|uniref:uncharacterized protein LOC121242329 n=1 Tax=Juglans microcarpa x Juglans regia TaxID=2249226 RepID=UPI001B7E6AC2|nr:uncharacterized protein LOC121242329 [Juglans microcarpa x Juglans regia]
MVMEMKLSDGRVLTSPKDIHEAACVYFEDFLKAKSTSSVPDLVGLILEEVSEEENQFFGSNPSVREVKDALFSIHEDSSPGPDGFGSGFFQHCWSLVYQHLLEAVSDFFGGAALPRYYVVMNGTAKGFFKGGRGLRQGDPLSPYLFILVEEVLSRLLKKKFELGRIKSFSHPRHGPVISHLLYADDMVIFANGGRSSVSEIVDVLHIYAKWSGQQFSEGVFRVRYLGVPVVSGRLKLIHFQDVIQKIQKKIEDSLWKRFFCAKYMHGKHPLELSPSGGTRFWKAIVKEIPVVLSRSKWKIREGNVSFWRDSWLNSGPLMEQYQMVGDPELKVKNCMITNNWDMEKLEQLVGSEKMEEIVNEISSRRTALPKKFSMVMWKALNSCLPMDDRIRRPGVYLVSKCECCRECAIEDINHVLYSGNIAKAIWKLSSNTLGIPFVPFWCWRATVEAWFQRASKSSQLGIKIHKDSRLGEKDVQILKSLNLSINSKKDEVLMAVRWERPKEDWFKLNVDGSSINNPGILGAGVVRNEFGKMVFMFAESIGSGSNNLAEVIALRRGLEHCKRLGLNNIIIEMDSLLVVNWVQDGRCSLWYLEDFWDDTMNMLAEMNFSIKHIYREGNKAADFLAQLGSNGVSYEWLGQTEVPLLLRGIHRTDSCGLAYRRKCGCL